MPTDSLLSWITFLPLAGAAAVLLMPNRSANLLKVVAFVFSLVTFALSLPLWVGFDSQDGGFQYLHMARWIPEFGIEYKVGVDGISLLLVILTTFFTPITLLAAWHDI